MVPNIMSVCGDLSRVDFMLTNSSCGMSCTKSRYMQRHRFLAQVNLVIIFFPLIFNLHQVLDIKTLPLIGKSVYTWHSEPDSEQFNWRVKCQISKE
jgi:hypothetical protein